MSDNPEDKPFPALPESLQAHSRFSLGSTEEHFKYRDAVMRANPHGHFPAFEDYNHMQYQIRDATGFAELLLSLIHLPDLPFIRK